MSKHYSLIVGHSFSLCNETDADPQSDYSPGIWAIKTQKRAMKYAKELLEAGNTITVTDYKNPSYHALANKFIKELGLDQPLFDLPEMIKQTSVSNGNPANLSQLKKYLSVGTKLNIRSFKSDGVTIHGERDTFVKRVQTNSVVLDKNGGDSWLEFGKADSWNFTDTGATKHYSDREGKMIPSTEIIYLK